MESIILRDREQEVIMFGEMVGVCWNVDFDETNNSWVKNGKPYIDFINVQERSGEFNADEESPVDGGLNLGEARLLIGELGKATDYLQKLFWANKY